MPTVPKAKGRQINLDAMRAARQETMGEQIEVVFGGETYRLPPELPFDFASYLAEGKMRAAFEALFGNDTERFFAARPSLVDMTDFANAISEEYGLGDTGESPASATSSSNGGN